ncbi:MAG: tRNA (N6-threonylcarbamoyladenosine(37)-N6)-methyltransferase TrmO [Burkholderiales bacterium]
MQDRKSFTVNSIGAVNCPVTEMSQGGWAKIESEIHVDPQLASGLQELAGFSHILVLFFLDRAQGFDPAKQLMRKPRGREDMQAVGVFAQRTKYRPNPIGITAVQLLGIEGNVVKVRGLDALDGTPVLDIKPYMPPFDRMENVRMPPWVEHFMDGYF